MKRRYVVLSLAVVLAVALAVPAFGGPTNIVSALTNVKKTANKALKKAKAASAAAASAQSTANGAQSDATAAAKAAKSAQTTATDGLTAAKAAQATANSALSAANTAKAAADAAQATANTKFGHTFSEFSPTEGPNTTSGLATSTCPAGSALTGGGYEASGAGANEVVPIFSGPYGTAWLTDLERIPAGTETWSVRAIAQCAKP